MYECSLCKRSIGTPTELATLVCADCARTIGVIPMPPSRRPPTPCARCNARRFVRVIPREHSTSPADPTRQVSAPMFATVMPRMHVGVLGQAPLPLEIDLGGVGLLEMYICAKCGFVEWYCVDVERIPIHPGMMTQLIDYDAASEAPYR
ncbi:MAG: hypothetical protein H0T79_02395 [Deltaproteobacteria bacterium]|nr:hypothetical protein [Deltaproteobacteria bacterium]